MSTSPDATTNTLLNATVPYVIPSVRDYRGLLKETEYKFKPDGGVDYRAMLKPEHLVFNRQMEDKIKSQYGKPSKELSVTEVEDKYLLILLSGIKFLAKIRGYISVKPGQGASGPGHASWSCSIKWIGNFETDFREEEFGEVGGANYQSTFSFAQLYLDSIAYNRSFVRAVRNYLGVNVVANDEVGPGGKEDFKEESISQMGHSPHHLLDAKLSNKDLSFAKFKDGWIKKYSSIKLISNPADWQASKDIPPNDIWDILNVISPQ